MATKRVKAGGLWRGPDGKTRPWLDTWGNGGSSRKAAGGTRRAAGKGGKNGSKKSGS